jgi:hypothetical protein
VLPQLLWNTPVIVGFLMVVGISKAPVREDFSPQDTSQEPNGIASKESEGDQLN